MLSSDEKLARIRSVLEDWISKQGHDACWNYPDLFKEICEILSVEVVDQNLPSRLDFEKGCCRYQEEIYKDPNS